MDNMTDLAMRTKTELGDPSSAPLSSELDVEKYRAYVDAFDLDDAQKDEFLHALWSIVRMFVEMGFEANICAQLFDAVTSECTPESSPLKSRDKEGTGSK